MLTFIIALIVAALGFWQARNFVSSRLRYVNGIQNPIAPVLGGLLAWLIAMPFSLLPLVTGGTALLFGASVATGIVSGARDVRKRLGAG